MKNIVFNAFLCCFFLLSFVSGSVEAKEEGVFTVNGVKVDVTAKNSTIAREQAFDQAQIIAFERLASRLINNIDSTSYETPELPIISSFVKDFEINKERLSAVRYVGDYGFRFNSKLVKKYFSTIGVEYTDVKSKPVLILPFYQTNNKTVIWSGYNPWFDGWRRSNSDRGLVPMLVPVGDISDISDISDDQALTYDQNGLERIVSRYGVKDAIILIASVKVSMSSIITVYVYRTDGGKPEYTHSFKIKQLNGELINSAIDRAVIEARTYLQKGWKEKTVVNSSQGNELLVMVPFKTMKEWVETHKVLKSVQGIGKIDVVSIKPGLAKLDLLFNGSERRLRLALEQADITLTRPQFKIDAGNDLLVYSLYMDKYRN